MRNGRCMEEELAALGQRQEKKQEVHQGSERNAAEPLVFLEEKELTEKRRIEVVWKFEANVEMLNIG